MLNYKRDCNYNFAACMRYFLVNINACIDRNNIGVSPKTRVKYIIASTMYRYDYTVIRLITKTFAVRNISVDLKSYKVNVEDGKTKYTYEFYIGMKENK